MMTIMQIVYLFTENNKDRAVILKVLSCNTVGIKYLKKVFIIPHHQREKKTNLNQLWC